MNWLLDNIYVTFGDKCFRQVIGIPMETDCAPFLANLFLYSYEYNWIDEQRKLNKWNVLKYFRNCSRYIDDLLMINNSDLMKQFMSEIYPEELVLVPDDTDGKSCPFLEMKLPLQIKLFLLQFMMCLAFLLIIFLIYLAIFLKIVHVVYLLEN